jgi:hypothetical protein
MTTSPLIPKALEQISLNDPDLQALELTALKKLHAGGLPISPILIVPAALEEHFYRLNNLPEQLSKLFSKVNLKRPDEDHLEDLAPQAQSLIKRHYFLDEIIDMLYLALTPLPNQVTVRRPQENGIIALKGRPTLMALKNIWVQNWSFENLLERIEKNSSIAITERPVIIQATGGVISESKSKEASQLLGQKVTIETCELGMTRVV